MEKKYLFQIYIAGIAPDMQLKIVDLKDQLTSKLGENSYKLKVVDVLDRPELAEAEHIIATPTIVRKSPTPTKKMIINLNDRNFTTLEMMFKD